MPPSERFHSRLDVRFHQISDFSAVEVVQTELLATNGCPAIHSSDDGSTIVVGDGAQLLRLRRDAAGTFVATPLATQYAPPPGPVAAAESEIVARTIPTRVQHKTFGEGTVQSAIGEGEGLKYLVLFDTAGPKTLLARFVQPID